MTKRVRRRKTVFGNLQTQTETYIPAKRGATRRTKNVGLVKPKDTVTEEWRLVENGRVID